LREIDREFLGVYHSHPGTRAQPSDRDVEEFHYRQVSYWILSLQEKVPQVKCFHWVDEALQETPFNLVDNPDGEGL
jgi:proteasome lid subunit RPN8/RPN11